MAIALGATGTAVYDTAAGTTCLVPYPAGISAGDCLVLFVARSASAITVPAGWTAFTGGQVTTTGGTTMLLAFKLAAGTESGNLSVTVASSTGHGRMFRFTGVDQTTPQDVTAGSVAANAATSVLPSLTTVTAGACLIGAGTDAGAVGGTYTISDGNYTEDDDSGQAVGASNGRNAALYHWISGAAGATGTKTLTHTNARAVGVHGALRPASGTAYTDAATVGIAITPSTVEVRESADAATVAIAITPNAIEYILDYRVYDLYTSRAASSGWGTPSFGPGAWAVVAGTASTFSVTAGIATIAYTASGTRHLRMASTNYGYIQGGMDIGWDSLPDSNGVKTEYFVGRGAGTGATDYVRAYLSVDASGTLTVGIDDVVASTISSGPSAVIGTYSVGDRWRLELVVTPEDACLVRAYNVSGPPSTYQVVMGATANTATGYVGYRSSATGTTATVWPDPLITNYFVLTNNGVIDVSLVPLAITPSGVDVYTPAGGTAFTDTATVTVAITPSSADTAQFVDSNTVSVAITPSVVEARISTDAATATIAITPSSAETAQLADANTVSLKITPLLTSDYLFAERFLDTTTNGWGTVDEGSLSPSGWTQAQGPTGDVSSGSGLGTIAAAGAQTYRLNAGVSLPTSFQAQGTFRTTLPAASNIQGFPCWFYQDNSNHFRGQILVSSAGTMSMQLQKVVAGVVTNIGQTGAGISVTTAGTYSANEVFNWKLKVNGSSYIFKVWDFGTDEPSDSPGNSTTTRYAVDTATDAAFSTGDYGFIVTGNAATVGFGPVIGNIYTTSAAYTDAATVGVVITPSSADVAAYVEAATVGLVITPSSTDVAAYVDAVTVPVVITPSAVDVKAAVDAATVTVALTPSTVEAAQFADTATVPVTLTPSGSDTQQFVEAATVPVTLTPSTVEARISTDSATVPVLITPSGVDALPNTDTGTVIVTLTPSAVEAAQFAETTTVPVAITPSTVEARISTDSANVLLALTASGVESAQFADTANVPITLSPTASETAQFADAVSVRLTLTPQSADTAQFVESATIPITLTPSAIEAYGRTLTDSGTVSMKFTPSAVESVGGGDAGTVPLTISSISDDVATYADTATATMKMTPSGTEFIERAFLDSAEVPVTITPSTVFEDLDKSDVGTPYVAITPDLLSEFQGEGDIITLRITALLGEIFVHDDSAVVLLSIVPDATELVSLTTMSTVVIEIEPGLLEDFFAGVDDATILLSITPGVILEVQQVADYLLVGVLSNKWTAILRDNTYAGTLFETRYVVTDFDNRWHYRYRGRGDE